MHHYAFGILRSQARENTARSMALKARQKLRKNLKSDAAYVPAFGIAFHGDYVGPGWSAGQYQNSVTSTAPARDEFDQTAKEHDATYATGGDLKAADLKFAAANIGQGLKRTVAGAAVGLQGIMRPAGDKTKKLLRGAAVKLDIIKRLDLKGLGAHRPVRGIGSSGPVPPGTPSFPKMPAPSTSTKTTPWEAKAANTGTDGEEVPVAKVPRLLSKVVPNHFTITLPYEFSGDFNPTTFTWTNSTPLLRIRLNSIYDPIVGAASNTQPQGRDLWATHFKYYRVLGCHVECTLFNGLPCTSSSVVNGKTHMFLWGFELADQDQTICTDLPGFLVSKHAKRQLLKAANATAYWDVTAGAVKALPSNRAESTFSYTYSPNDWNYHVREVGSEERWTPIAQNPSVDHDLVIRAFHCHSTNAPTSDADGWWLILQVQYVVQFMEEDEAQYKVRDTSAAGYPDGGGGADD